MGRCFFHFVTFYFVCRLILYNTPKGESMKKHFKYAAICTLFLSLSACGSGSQVGKVNQSQDKAQTHTSIPENDSGWKTIETISDRNIIAKLEQTIPETPKWNQTVQEVKEREDYKKGQFGKPSDELAEELAIQNIAANIVIPLLEKTYGGYKGLDEAGVIFAERKTLGAKQSGFWIGIKKPDDRLKKFMGEMQKKVDAGVIKAKYIYIFHTPHTTAENNILMRKVNEKVKVIVKSHETPDRLAGGVSVDTITGNIEIEHNFLTKEQKNGLVDAFPSRKVVFHQQGRLVPKKGEKDTTYPKEKFTKSASKEGQYVMGLSEESMLVVSAKAMDFSQNGGEKEFYSAVNYHFPAASQKLSVGQRVNIEPSGPIMESYPGQGTALYVAVLPEYKPDDADLSESEVVQLGMEKAKSEKNNNILAIRDISYNELEDLWMIEFKRDTEVIGVKIEDKKE